MLRYTSISLAIAGKDQMINKQRWRSINFQLLGATGCSCQIRLPKPAAVFGKFTQGLLGVVGRLLQGIGHAPGKVAGTSLTT